MKILLSIIILLLAVWTGWSYYAVKNVETPSYAVIEEKTDYEIRDYDPYLIAEVEVEGSTTEALNKGFRILADYIFGNNTKNSEIAMTAPVTENTADENTKNGEDIPMSTPVLERIDKSQKRIVSFIMPSEYTKSTLPYPNNPDIKIRSVDSKKIAALKFSWWASNSLVQKKEEELLNALKRDKIETIGNTQYAGYNPPFTIPFLIRNEIWVEIK